MSDLQHIFAPWRKEYVQSAKPKGCIFCEKPLENDDAKNLILYRGYKNFVIMNAYPYNPGHLMVTPFRHVGKVELMTDEESAEAFALVRKSVSVLSVVSQPHGFNVGMNLGAVAGAGIVDHVHIHVVPRWNGDTNFMPVVARTKVVSEALTETYEKLRPAFQALEQVW